MIFYVYMHEKVREHLGMSNARMRSATELELYIACTLYVLYILCILCRHCWRVHRVRLVASHL